MHSVAPDSSGSPKKRTLSRGMSEDESLRSIIKETDSSSRRLTRSDSRAGTLKRRTDSQQSDQDLFMGLPEMLELQASYDEVVQELRGLEVEREALLFQVDVLQDTLEGVEELLAEAQREAGQASLELDHEREAKKKLESMVRSLMQEVERLKQERSTAPCFDSVDGATRAQTANGSRQPQASEEAEGGSKGTEEEEGSVVPKVRRMVTKPLGHVPSLALDNPVAEDGVHRRPYENGTESGRDSSPDRNDSDSISAYEDASAETPEQDRIFPGEADCAELPDDSIKEVTDHGPQDSKNPDGCIVS